MKNEPLQSGSVGGGKASDVLFSLKTILFALLSLLVHQLFGREGLSAGGDRTICRGDTALLRATGGEGLGFTWSHGLGVGDAKMACPEQTTTYTVRTPMRTGNNLVANGDFEQGNVGFSSEYAYRATGNVVSGCYSVRDNPASGNSAWANCSDKNPGSSAGKMLIADGACGYNKKAKNSIVWQQTISGLKKNTNYAFSAWLTSFDRSKGSASSQLAFYANGSLIGTPVVSAQANLCDWKEYYVFWNSGEYDEVTIALRENLGQCHGNDFAVDDIRFYEYADVSAKVTITVNAIGGTAISADHTVCSGGMPDKLLGAVGVAPAGSAIRYAWRQSPNGKTDWTPIPDATDREYRPSALASTTYYQRRAISALNGTTCERTSNTVRITVNEITPGSITTESRPVCQGMRPEEIVSEADGQSLAGGQIGYRWEKSTDGGNSWETIPGETGKSHLPEELAATAQFRRVAVSTVAGRECRAKSNVLTVRVITVPPPLGKVVQHTCQSLADATPLSFLQPQDSTIRWYAEQTGGTPLPDDHRLVHGRTYHASETINGCESMSRLAVTFMADIAIDPGSIAADQAVCHPEGRAARLTSTVDATGSGAIGYSWTLRKVGGGGWEHPSFGNGSELAEPLVTTDPAYLFPGNKLLYVRHAAVTVDGTTCRAASNTASITVHRVEGGAIAGRQTVCLKTIPDELTSVSEGKSPTGGQVSYRWEKSTDGGNKWRAIPGETEKSYRPGALEESAQFRRVAICLVDGQPICEVPANNTVTVTVRKGGEDHCKIIPEKSVQDSSGNGLAEAGELLAYTINIKSTFDRDIRVRVVDTIPAGTIYEAGSASHGGRYDKRSNTLHWETSEGEAALPIPKEKNTALSFRVRVAKDMTDMPAVKNRAVVDKIPSPARPGPRQEADADIRTRPILKYEAKKTVSDENGDGRAQAGEVLTYTIAVNNTGDADLPGLPVSDAIPAGTTYIPGTMPAGATLDRDTLKWKMDIPFGKTEPRTFKVRVLRDLTGIDWIRNLATVGDTTIAADIPTDPAAKMSLTKEAVEAERHSRIGERVEYAVTVRNEGNIRLENILVTDDNADDLLLGTVAGLAPGGDTTLTAYHTVTQADVDAGRVDNQASATAKLPKGGRVTAESTDPHPCRACTPKPNCPNCTTVCVDQGRGAAIALDKKALDHDADYRLGDRIAYAIVLKNTGDLTLLDITVTDNNADDPAVGHIDALAPGASRSFPVFHTITQGDMDEGKVTNTALAEGEDPNGRLVVEKAKTTVIIAQKTGMALEKSVDKKHPAYKLGDRVEYAITVRNTGNVTLSNIAVTDDNADDRLVGRIAALAPGASKSFTAFHTVTQADIDEGKVTNTALAAGKDPNGRETKEKSTDPDCNNCPDSATTVPVAPSKDASMAMTKEVVHRQTSYKPGAAIRYKIIVANTGGITLKDIAVVDSNADDPEIGHIAILAPGGREEFLAYHTVTQADAEAGTVENLAQAIGMDPKGADVVVESTDPTCTSCSPDPACPTCTVINIWPAIVAADDHLALSLTDRSSEGSVLDNDLLDGLSVNPADIVLTPMMPDHPGLRMEEDGTISAAITVRPGRYAYPYRICEVSSPKNCAEAQAVVEVRPDDRPFLVPNVFTPNGDGANDTFVIAGLDRYDRVEVAIINHFGNLVYASEDYHNDWDGNGLKDGTYFYSVLLHGHGSVQTIKGSVTLMRGFSMY